MSIRKTAVAGAFYSNNPQDLTRDIETHFQNASYHYLSRPLAIIAPHAGYPYSGPVAANAYRGLQKFKDDIQRVVLLGPSHYVAFEGIAATSATHYESPLGNIQIDHSVDTKLKDLKQIGFFDPAHVKEHSLEVHLPFLQKALGEFSLIPLVVGQSAPDKVAEVIDLFIDEPGTLIVISTDLSHYHPYEEAQKIDGATVAAIESFDWQKIGPKEACGAFPVGGLLALAKTKNLRIERIDVRNSGDTAGPRDHVVGYASFAIFSWEDS